MADLIDEEKLNYKDGGKVPDIDKPDKFSQIKWVASEETVYTYFADMRNSWGVPLVYNILNTPAPSDIFIDREQDIIQKNTLQGNMFSCNTKKVLVIIKDIIVYTDDETWTKEKHCGQEVMLELKNHYDGK